MPLTFDPNAVQPKPANGQFDWGDEVTRWEQTLGRDLTPEEADVVRDKVLEAAVLDAAAQDPEDENELEVNGPLWDLVLETVSAHPEWSMDTLRQEIRRKLAGGS
jgi:hypothetical protein